MKKKGRLLLINIAMKNKFSLPDLPPIEDDFKEQTDIAQSDEFRHHLKILMAHRLSVSLLSQMQEYPGENNHDKMAVISWLLDVCERDDNKLQQIISAYENKLEGSN